MKKINFPLEEVEILKKRSCIITTRVSREYNCYSSGDILQSPWGDLYIVDKVKKINCVKQHPFYNDLTTEQIQLISKYKRIDVLTLKKL